MLFSTGNGALFLLEIDKSQSALVLLSQAKWKDVLTDVCWNPSSPDLLVTSSGDGHLILWKADYSQSDVTKSQSASDTNCEISCVQFNHDGSRLLSSAWDGIIKIVRMQGKSLLTIITLKFDVFSGTT
jgi:WD40 repeat protein